jgi:O-antigen/teichoic acid export membrane protein
MSVESALASGTPASRWLNDASDRLVLRNAIALVAAYVLPRGALFLSSVIAARILGDDAYGAFSTAGALAVILSIVATAGMQPLLVREMSTHPASAPALLATAHRAKALTGIIMLLGTAAVALLLHYSPVMVAATLFLALAYGVGSYCENFGAWFQARERMHIWTQATTIFGVTAAIAGVTMVLLTHSIIPLCLAQLAGQCAALAWLHRSYRRDTHDGGGAAAFDVPALLRAAAPFAAAFLALTIFYKIDLLMLQRMWGNAEAGTYGAAYRLIDAAVAIALAGIGAVYPRLARRSAGGGRGFASRAVMLAVCIALAFSAVVAPGARVIIGILFGEHYRASASVLVLLAAAFPALTCNLLAGYVLAAEKSVRQMAFCYAGALIMKLTAIMMLVPRFGAQGAATAMLSCEILLCCAFLTVLHRRGAIAMPAPALLLAGAPAAAIVIARVLV